MRRDPNDVFWLKENAELLNILECSASMLDSYDLSAYAQIYDNLPKRLAFFPQYYRFFASIALDLEGLSLAGDHAETICARINQQGLVKAELPDLQHAKTMRLLMRRCIGGAKRRTYRRDGTALSITAQPLRCSIAKRFMY